MYIVVTLANVCRIHILALFACIKRFIANTKSKQELEWIVEATIKRHAGIPFATCTLLGHLFFALNLVTDVFINAI